MSGETVSRLEISLAGDLVAQLQATTARLSTLSGAIAAPMVGLAAAMPRTHISHAARLGQRLCESVEPVRQSVAGFAAGLAGGVGLAAAHANLMQFSLAMRETARANPNWTPAQLQALSAKIQETRVNSPFSSREFAEGANTLARAGIDDISSLGAALPILNTAAQATSLSFEQLSDYLVVMSSRFGLSTKDADSLSETFQYLAGLMTRVSEIAPGKVFDYVNAMKLVGSAVPSLKVDVQDLTGLYVMLDKAGIQNEEAGATLRATIKGLIHPTRQGRIRMAELGIDPSAYATSRRGTGAALARGLGASFGGLRAFAHMAPFFDEVFAKGLGDAETGDQLYEIAARMFGGKLKPQDAQKLRKAIASYLSSNVETLDLQKAIELFNDRDVSFGQLIDLVEARQAGRAMLTIRQPEGPVLPGQQYVTPRSMMLNPDTGKRYTPMELYQRTRAAAAKQFDGYAKSFDTLRASFDLLLRTFGESYVFRRMTAVIKGLGTAINDLNRGTGDPLTAAGRLLGAGLLAWAVLAPGSLLGAGKWIWARVPLVTGVMGALARFVAGVLPAALMAGFRGLVGAFSGFGSAAGGVLSRAALGLGAGIMGALGSGPALMVAGGVAAVGAALFGCIKLWENRNPILQAIRQGVDSLVAGIMPWLPSLPHIPRPAVPRPGVPSWMEDETRRIEREHIGPLRPTPGNWAPPVPPSAPGPSPMAPSAIPSPRAPGRSSRSGVTGPPSTRITPGSMGAAPGPGTGPGVAESPAWPVPLAPSTLGTTSGAQRPAPGATPGPGPAPADTYQAGNWTAERHFHIDAAGLSPRAVAERVASLIEQSARQARAEIRPVSVH